MSEPGTYKFEDIQRYLQHKMSAQEMHAFEKAMMDDPFLADAIEGYRKSNGQVSTTHLADIERQLTEGKEKARVVAMPSHKNSWWKIAAIVLIILTGAAISYQLLNNSTTKDIPKEVAATKPQASPIATDSTVTSFEAPADKKPVGLQQAATSRDNVAFNYKRKEPANRNGALPSSSSLQSIEASRQTANDVARIDNEMAGKKEEMLTSAPSAIRDSVQMSIASRSMSIRGDTVQRALQGRAAGMQVSALKKETQATKINEFKGSVTDDAGAPVAGAAVIVKSSNRGTTTDGEGNFTIKAADTSVHVVVSSVGLLAARAKLTNSAKDNKIVLERNNNSLSEVVVTAVGKKNKKNNKFNNKGSAVPEGGWDSFEKYTGAQIRNFEDSTNNTYSGDLEIEFSTDKKGRPQNIRIQQQADKATIDKAKEIIQNGPKWTGKKRDKIKVTLHF
jgi:hypothetical protein